MNLFITMCNRKTAFIWKVLEKLILLSIEKTPNDLEL